MRLKCDLCGSPLGPSSVNQLIDTLGRCTHKLCTKCYNLVVVFISVSKFKGSKDETIPMERIN